MLDLPLVQGIRRAVLACFTLIVLVGLFVTQSATATDSATHLATEILGWTAIVACIAGRTWCSFYIAGRKGAQLIQQGPYSVVRNPLYVFSTLGAAGVGLSAGSLVLAIMLALVVFAIFNTVIEREERFLRERLGASYEQYLQRTPRWLPRLENWEDVASVEISPRLVARTFFDAIWIGALVPILEIIEKLQGLGHLPVFLRMP